MLGMNNYSCEICGAYTATPRIFELMSYEKAPEINMSSMSTNGQIYQQQAKHKTIVVCDKCLNALYMRKYRMDNSNFSNFSI